MFLSSSFFAFLSVNLRHQVTKGVGITFLMWVVSPEIFVMCEQVQFLYEQFLHEIYASRYVMHPKFMLCRSGSVMCVLT